MLEFFRNLSPTELASIVIILLVFFGSKIIVRLARNSGETLKELKKIKKDFAEGMSLDEGSKVN